MDRLKNLSGNGKFAEFPPNCLQFKALCMAFYEELGLPNKRDAYRDIMNSVYIENPRWSHALIKFIANRLPDNFFLIEHKLISDRIFKEVYEQVCDLVKQGHELSETQEQPKFRSQFKVVWTLCIKHNR